MQREEEDEIEEFKEGGKGCKTNGFIDVEEASQRCQRKKVMMYSYFEFFSNLDNLSDLNQS